MVLPTNATSADNALAGMTPTSMALDRVVQTNREGNPLEYREIKTTEHILKPTLLDEIPPAITTKIVEYAPVEPGYVLKQIDEYEPLAVISDTSPVDSANNQIVGITTTGSLTTPGKIVGDLEPVLWEDHLVTVAEPVPTKVVKNESTETI
jgi:hypothetical protein